MKPTLLKKTRVIGLTGNTGSGKTTIAGIFRELGAVIIDADRIGKEALEKNEALRRSVIKAFGGGILDSNGGIVRKKLGAIVFSDPEQLQRLNELIGPYLWPEVKRRIQEEKSGTVPLIVVDAALIFEARIENWFDAVVVVIACENTSAERIMKRDGLNREEALMRMRSQMDIQRKISGADHVVANEDDMGQLRWEVQRIYDRYA